MEKTDISQAVYFYTGSFTHPFYREQFRYPPSGYRYVPSSPDLESAAIRKDIAQSMRWYYPYMRWIEDGVVGALAALRLPKFHWIKHPSCELIHSAQYPLLNRQPWVVDFEDVSTFSWYRRDVLNSPFAKAILQSIFASSSCKAILPWTEAARRSIEHGLDCSRFRNKIRVVYPTITPQSDIEQIFLKKRANRKIKVLFVGTAFYAKGGVEALIVLDELSREYPMECRIVSNVPEEYRRKYAGNPAIQFSSKISPEELKNYYIASNLFLAPYHTDTFGYVVLEAFSYGIPCVATDQFALPEIVSDKVTGRIIKNSLSRFDENMLPKNGPEGELNIMIEKLKKPPRQYLDNLKKAVALMIENREQLEIMGRNAYEEISKGKFSSSNRQRILSDVYAAARR